MNDEIIVCPDCRGTGMVGRQVLFGNRDGTPVLEGDPCDPCKLCKGKRVVKKTITYSEVE